MQILHLGDLLLGLPRQFIAVRVPLYARKQYFRIFESLRNITAPFTTLDSIGSDYPDGKGNEEEVRDLIALFSSHRNIFISGLQYVIMPTLARIWAPMVFKCMLP